MTDAGPYDYDVVVIGGGIVGLSTAMSLGGIPGLSLAVLEAEDRLAAHQTGNNSGVIHSGLYYKPGSLKARNCVEGRKALYAFCKENGISHEGCGKIVVAREESRIPALVALEERGRANGLAGLRRLSREEIRHYEPHVSGAAALLVPETGIVDFVQVAKAYGEKVRAQGGEILLGTRVMGIRREAGKHILTTSRGIIRCSGLINCAGLHSDRVARMCGLRPGLRIIPFRGEYYVLRHERSHLVKNLVYPVPDPAFPFLGVHFTRMIHGGVEAGPNAVLAFKREGYEKLSFSLRDFMEIVLFPGFWRMAARYWKMGFHELHRSFSKSAFVLSLQELVPEVGLEDVTRGGAGVRAQAVDEGGRLVDDFRIEEGEGMIHVLNAPSPAATASLSIGKAVADRAARAFRLS